MEQPPLFNFSASVPIVEGRVTYLKFSTPDAPEANRDIVPTITRNCLPSPHDTHGVTVMGRISPSTLISGKQDAQRVVESLGAAQTCSYSGKPALSGQSCISRDDPSSLSHRMPSQTIHRSQDISPTQACPNRSPGSLPPNHTGAYDETWLHQLHKEERKCQKTNAEKDNGIDPPMLCYFETDGEQPISAPPPGLSSHPKLQIGDLFCYRQAGRSEPLLWIWTREHGAHAHCDWQRVFAGFTRPVDGRMLAIVGTPKRPTWVTGSWYRRRFLKQTPRD